MKKTIKKSIKWTALVLVVLLVYVIGSLVLPPAFRPEAKEPVLSAGATGERIVCIDDNTDALIWRLRMIESAQEEIILSTFGFSTGSSGRDILCALHAAAERGVQVRLLLDGFSGTSTVDDSEEFQTLIAMPNVDIRIYNEISILQVWKANYRMHDKYLIADNQMYMLGGRNTNDLFLGDYSDTPNIDRDILVWGTGLSGSLGQLRSYFETVWNQPDCNGYDAESFKSAQSSLRGRYESLHTLYPEAFGFTDWEGQTIPANAVTVITGSTRVGTKAPDVWKHLCAYMEQGQEVLIQTPYVICSDEMYEDLEDLSEGRSVTILTNSPETGANYFGCADYLNHQDDILDTGVNILEYTAEHSLHAKTILIDDNISIVGSFNLDMRSAYIDTETMLVVDCPELNAYLRGETEKMAQESLHIAPDGTRTPGSQYKAVERPFFWSGLGIALLRIVEALFRHLL